MILEELLHVLETEAENQKLAQRFKNSASAIAFLLRRRVYSEEFLEAGSPLAKRIKQSMKEAIRVVNGLGKVSLAPVLENIINYVDGCGSNNVSMSQLADESDSE